MAYSTSFCNFETLVDPRNECKHTLNWRLYIPSQDFCWQYHTCVCILFCIYLHKYGSWWNTLKRTINT